MHTVHVWQAIEGDKSLVKMNFFYTNEIDIYVLTNRFKTYVNITGVQYKTGQYVFFTYKTSLWLKSYMYFIWTLILYQ